MEAEPTFRTDSDAIAYWRQLANERQADFDELQDMNTDYEREMEAQIERLESEKKTTSIQNARLTKELEDFRDKHQQTNSSREEELDRLKLELETETSQKLELTKLNRILEQELDDYDRKYRQLHSSYEQNQELLLIETERNAMLETDVCEKTNLQELVQRLRDEKRDLKSEIEVREKLHKREKPLVRREISNEEPPSDLENRVDGESGVALPRRTAVNSSGLSIHDRSSHTSPHHPITSPSSSMSSIHSNSSSQSRLSALSIVGDLLRKVGALETKLASCRTFVRDNSSTIPNPSQVTTTPRRTTSSEKQNISPLRTNSSGLYNSTSPHLRTSHSASFTTPTSRRGTPTSNFNSQSPHESRIGERLVIRVNNIKTEFINNIKTEFNNIKTEFKHEFLVTGVSVPDL